jgi:hypothetical protein
MRERVIAPTILIWTLRGPGRQAGPVIPNSGDVRRCMGVGLLSVTGLPVSPSSAGESSRASCQPHGVAKALAACCGRRPCPQMRAFIRWQLTAGAARNTYAGGAGPVRASQAQKSPDRGRRHGAWRALDVPVGGYLSAPRWPLSGGPRIAPGMLVVRGAGAGCAGGRIRCLPGRPERASSRCRPGRRRRAWRRERAAAPARRPGRGRWR